MINCLQVVFLAKTSEGSVVVKFPSEGYVAVAGCTEAQIAEERARGRFQEGYALPFE